MTQRTEIHYLATVVIKKVERPILEQYDSTKRATVEVHGERRVTDLASINIKHASLEPLKDRIGKHVALVDELDYVDDDPDNSAPDFD